MISNFVRRRLGGRLGLLISLMLLFAIFPLQQSAASSPSAPPNPDPAELRVMTYNIRHSQGMDGEVRPEAVLQDLRVGRPDVIALQEVDRYKSRSGFQDQARYFAKALGMHYAYAPAIRSGMSQYGIALLSRYPLDTPKRYMLTGGREPRCLLTAELHIAGRTITVATTHLGVAASEREQQLPQLVEALKPVTTPLVVMGDFNSSLSALPRSGLTRLQLPEHTSTVLNGGEIDHIFFSPELMTETGASVIPSRASDHIPVAAAVTLKSPHTP